MLELTRRLHVEAENTELQPLGELVVGLADAGEDDLAGIAACGDHAGELAAGNDVESAAQAREHVEDREIRVGLKRVTDEVTQSRKGLVELAVCSRQRGARIYEAGCSVARRDLGERHTFDAERALALGERGHCVLSVLSSAAGSTGAGVADALPGIRVGGAPGGRTVGGAPASPGGPFAGPRL